MSDDTLIEMMADAGYYAYRGGGYKDNAFHSIAKGMLSVVRANVHLVAKVCDATNCNFGQESYQMMGEIHYRTCQKCNGHGVVAREDKP